jgi:hypothetical protein
VCGNGAHGGDDSWRDAPFEPFMAALVLAT